MDVFTNLTLALLRIARVRLHQRWQGRFVRDEIGLIHR